MELRHIRYFLAVAAERNFTRAATRLRIGQPPLSMQIRDLEREMGAQLFHRGPRGVELTDAGKAFHELAKHIPMAADDAVRAAQRAARGETGHLTLGFTGTAALNPIVSTSIRAFRRHHPDVTIKLEEAVSTSLVHGLVTERLDVAILRPVSSCPPEIQMTPLIEEPLVAVLPVSHWAAAADDPLDLAMLADDPIILTPSSVGGSLRDSTIAACRAAGFEPNLGQAAPQIASILSLVAAEVGVALVPACMGQLNIQGVAIRTFRDPAPGARLMVAHRRAFASRLAINFAAIAGEAAQPSAA